MTDIINVAKSIPTFYSRAQQRASEYFTNYLEENFDSALKFIAHDATCENLEVVVWRNLRRHRQEVRVNFTTYDCTIHEVFSKVKTTTNHLTNIWDFRP